MATIAITAQGNVVCQYPQPQCGAAAPTRSMMMRPQKKVPAAKRTININATRSAIMAPSRNFLIFLFLDSGGVISLDISLPSP